MAFMFKNPNDEWFSQFDPNAEGNNGGVVGPNSPDIDPGQQGYMAGTDGSVNPIQTPQGGMTGTQPTPGSFFPTPTFGAPAQQAPQQAAPQNYGAAPLGFDPAKWADPNLGDSKKYQASRILAGGGTIEQAAQAVGAKVISPDKIQYPDGFIADMYFDYGGPNQRVQYTDVTGEGQGGGAGAGSGSGALSSVAGGSGGAGTGNTGAGYMLQPWAQHFQAPTYDQISSDPQYRFQFDQGNQAIQRGAAARGTLLTGGTLKDQMTFGQGLASTFADKAYGRAWNEYQNNKGEFYDSQDRPFGKLSQVAGLGQATATNSANQSQNYANALGGLYADQGNVNAAGRVGQANAWQNYLDSVSGSLFR